MDQQILRNWVHRYNAEGLDGPKDRHSGGTPYLLSPDQEQTVARWVTEGPDLARGGVTR